ncbi:hypothetical protein BH10BAC5_BH10BAC5_16780 [soil metagenome]
METSGIRLIDFNNFENNFFNVVTELTCKNGDDEFRPDITLLINGMPLAFIEVKKPNNLEGILAERDRINVRFANKKFRKFINISQILVFSNNMEYDSPWYIPRSFRNFLAHEYPSIRIERVYRAASDLDELDSILKQVLINEFN